MLLKGKEKVTLDDDDDDLISDDKPKAVAVFVCLPSFGCFVMDPEMGKEKTKKSNAHSSKEIKGYSHRINYDLTYDIYAFSLFLTHSLKDKKEGKEKLELEERIRFNSITGWESSKGYERVI